MAAIPGGVLAAWRDPASAVDLRRTIVYNKALLGGGGMVMMNSAPGLGTAGGSGYNGTSTDHMGLPGIFIIL
ncbi:MAG: hypothetical protein GY696_28465 [Gammaproteobacteria bacterium]|nr:hypothetical protein [Gammaproteobacteria bacterium]